MYIDVVPNRTSPPAVLLRESVREGKKIRKRTVANLSRLPMDQIDAIARILRGDKLVPLHELFGNTKARQHGHVQAVLQVMNRLGFAALLGSKPSRQRDLAVALVAARILAPEHSKLAITRWWHDTTLPSMLEVADADEDELYAAMDWLLERQLRIEKKLAARHLKKGGIALYDLSSSYFEGVQCPLGKLGFNRDEIKGKLQVNYGVLTDARGCPIAVSVFNGNTGDPKTLLPQVDRLKGDFKLDEFILVGDRGMISQKQIDVLREIDGVDWVTALKSGAIAALVQGGAIQPGLFDERNLFELIHADFPGERLVACRNPELAKLRAAKRSSLLEATTKELAKVRAMVAKGRLSGMAKIGVRIGRVINRFKVAKHFEFDINDNSFEYRIDHEKVEAEAALDGLYVIRTSVDADRLDTDDTVRAYKGLSNVERAFRTFKSIDLHIRPIRHYIETRVRAHIFVCMLAYYVQWHMFQAWRPLLFADVDLKAKTTADPVAPAKRSAEAKRKAQTHTLDDGTDAHSFTTLLDHLKTVVRNTGTRPGPGNTVISIDYDTSPNTKQQQAFDLIAAIRP